MRIDYDAETDTLRIVLKETSVRESEEERSGVILDYDATGQLVALEILDTSARVDTVGDQRRRGQLPLSTSCAELSESQAFLEPSGHQSQY